MDGKILSGYRISTSIGSGAMGVVYKGTHIKTGIEAAIKILPQRDHSPQEYALLKKRLTDEASAVQNLDSPYIVRVIDVGQTDELGFHIVMELMNGASLEDNLPSFRRWRPDEFIHSLAKPLLMGLNDLHQAGVLHRDIKSANLLQDKDGSYKIADFGLAIFEGRTAKTKTGVIIGTPGYMAPECIHGGTKATTSSSDIYSAGVTLFEAIAGKHPFGGKTLIETVKNQLSQTPNREFLTKRTAKFPLSNEAAAIIVSAISINPGHRPSSALNFFNDLKTAIETYPAPSDADVLKESQCRTIDNSSFSLRAAPPHSSRENPDSNINRNEKRSDRADKTLKRSAVKSASDIVGGTSPFSRTGKLLILSLTVIALAGGFGLYRFAFKPQKHQEDVSLASQDSFCMSLELLNDKINVYRVEALKKSVETGLIFQTEMSDSLKLSSKKRLARWTFIEKEYGEDHPPSLLSFIQTRAKPGKENALAIKSFTKELRDSVIDQARHLTLKDLTEISHMETYLTQEQTKNAQWATQTTPLVDFFTEIVNESERFIEHLHSAIIWQQQMRDSDRSKEVARTLAPLKLRNHILRSAIFADSSGETFGKLCLDKDLSFDEAGFSPVAEQQLKENKKRFVTESINTDCARAILESIKLINSSCKIKTISRMVNALEPVISRRIEQLENLEPSVKELLPSETGHLSQAKELFSPVNVSKEHLFETVDNVFFSANKVLKEYSVNAPLKSLERGYTTKTIYDPQRHATAKRISIALRRVIWYLYPLTLLYESANLPLSIDDVVLKTIRLDKLFAKLISRNLTLGMYVQFFWTGPSSGKNAVLSRWTNSFHASIRQRTLRDHESIVTPEEIIESLKDQKDFLTFFNTYRRCVFNLQRDCETSSDPLLQEYTNIAEDFHSNIKESILRQIACKNIATNILLNKTVYITRISEMSENDTKEASLAGEAALDFMADWWKQLPPDLLGDGLKVSANLLSYFIEPHWDMLRAEKRFGELKKQCTSVFNQYLAFTSSKEVLNIARTDGQSHYYQTNFEEQVNCFNIAVVNLCHIAIVNKDDTLYSKMSAFLPQVEETANNRLRRKNPMKDIRLRKPIQLSFE